MEKIKMSLRLNSNQFHTGLNEICRHFEDNHSDEELNGLVQEVENARGMLFQAIKKELAKEGIKEESFLLRERLASATHYIDSFQYEPDAEVKASAKALKRQLRKYGVFYKMDVHSRLTEVQAMLRDMETSEMKAHVAKIPGLETRIKNVQTAMEALLNRLVAVEKMRGEAKPQKSKLELKREAAAKLERLLVYLDHKAYKEPDTYGKDYGFVVGLITNLNKTYKPKVRKFVEDFDEDWDEDFEEEESPENTDGQTTGKPTIDELPESADSTKE